MHDLGQLVRDAGGPDPRLALASVKALTDELQKFEKQLEDAGAPLVLGRAPLPGPATEEHDEGEGDGGGWWLF